MSELEAPPAVTDAVERGRYAVYGDGTPMGWVVSRATDLCDSCAACGCGTPQEPLSVAGMLKTMPLGFGKMLRGLMPHGS